MSITIHKEVVANPRGANLDVLPGNAVILDFQIQNGRLVFWYEFDRNDPAANYAQQYEYYVLWTGHTFDSTEYVYRQTLQHDGTVYHIFEKQTNVNNVHQTVSGNVQNVQQTVTVGRSKVQPAFGGSVVQPTTPGTIVPNSISSADHPTNGASFYYKKADGTVRLCHVTRIEVLPVKDGRQRFNGYDHVRKGFRTFYFDSIVTFPEVK